MRLPKGASTREGLESRHLETKYPPQVCLRRHGCFRTRQPRHSGAARLLPRSRGLAKLPLTLAISSSLWRGLGSHVRRQCLRQILHPWRKPWWSECRVHPVLSQTLGSLSLMVGIRGVEGWCLVHNGVRIAVARLLLLLVPCPLSNKQHPEKVPRQSSVTTTEGARNHVRLRTLRADFSLPRIERLSLAYTAHANDKVM